MAHGVMRPETGSRSHAAALVTGTVVVVANVPPASVLNSVALGEDVVRVAVVEAGGLPVRVVVSLTGRDGTRCGSPQAPARRRWSGVVRSIMVMTSA